MTRQYLGAIFRVSLCHALAGSRIAAMTMPANRTQPSRQMMVDLTSLPSIESYMSRCLNRGRPRLPKAWWESAEYSGGGRLHDVAGQMVFDPAVITARLSELLRGHGR
jgi:hypothetical protein